MVLVPIASFILCTHWIFHFIFTFCFAGPNYFRLYMFTYINKLFGYTNILLTTNVPNLKFY